MSSVRVNAGHLFFDFRYRGVRCREYTKQPDTKANRKLMQRVLDKIEAQILDGSFDYAHCFPGSHNAARLRQTPIAAAVSAPQAAAMSPASPATPVYKDFTQTWFTENEPAWRRSHRATVLSTVQSHLIPAFGDQPVGAISKADCLAFRAQLAKRHGRAGNETLSAKTINRIMQIHSQILGEAAERYAFPDPTLRIKRLKQRRVDIHPFSLTEVQQILVTVRADYRPYLTVRFFTGLRTGEVNGLQWKYVDFERHLLLVRETWVRGHVEYTKTDGSQRDVALSQPVYAALKAQQEITGALGGFVFCNANGEPIDLDNFTNRVWYPLLRYLDIERRRPYQTRHTAATLWLASGENPEWVARQLGHANTEMLFKTYSRYVPNLTRSDGAAMERLLAAQLHVPPVNTTPLRPMVHTVPAALPALSASGDQP
ncbi:MAG TPA: DUF3596 domain-containing protein [Rhodanobacteraceae bacterium]